MNYTEKITKWILEGRKEKHNYLAVFFLSEEMPKYFSSFDDIPKENLVKVYAIKE